MSLREHPLELWRRHCADRRRFVRELEALATRLRSDERRLGDERVRADAVSRSLATIDARLAEASAALAVAERQLQRHESVHAAQRADAPRGRRLR